MTKEERQKVEELIKQKIEKLKIKIAGYEDMSAPVTPENSIGRISRMDAINNKSVFEASLRKAKTELRALQKALFVNIILPSSSSINIASSKFAMILPKRV